jgi:hypothetical protein
MNGSTNSSAPKPHSVECGWQILPFYTIVTYKLGFPLLITAYKAVACGPKSFFQDDLPNGYLE